MRIKLNIAVGEQRYSLQAEVLRIWKPDDIGQQNLSFATVKFLHADISVERLLYETIFRIQRELIASNKLMS
ncbi:MAG: hypothetical protein CSYNP_02394 [Syntrophus sp. SKADARSKE-3]|nr:hypothetical protein [Syntrophus sp. SKADARSKE-3]